MGEKIKASLFIFVLSLLSLHTVVPLFAEGFFTMHDNTQVARVYVMYKSMYDGMFPVRWVQDLGYGYGYPIFNFYAPLPYYIGAFFYFITQQLVLSTKIMIGIGILLAGITMYISTVRLFGKWAALAASITYLYFPYHALNVYVRGAIGETYAYAFLPLVFYGIFLTHEKLKEKNLKKIFYSFLLTSLSFAAVILSHNLTAFMLIIMLIPLYIVGLFTTKFKLKFTYLLALSVLLGVGLSAFYSLPAILEMGYTNVRGQVGGGADFVDHFVCLNQFWNSAWGFGGSTPTCVDGMSFALGKNNILFALVSLALIIWFYLYKKGKESKFALLTSSIIFLLSIFLTLKYSSVVWTILPGIEFLQYPWRFLNFTGLSLSLIIAGAIWILTQKNYGKAAIVFCVIVVASQVILHRDIFSAQNFEYKTNDEYKNQKYLNFEVSKISDEYLPQNFNKPTSKEIVPEEKIDTVEGNIEALEIDTSTDKITAKLIAKEEGILRINSAPYPAWKLFIDEVSTPYKSGDDGVYVNVPKDAQKIEYVYKSTNTQKLANTISFIAIIICILGIIWQQKKDEKTS